VGREGTSHTEPSRGRDAERQPDEGWKQVAKAAAGAPWTRTECHHQRSSRQQGGRHEASKGFVTQPPPPRRHRDGAPASRTRGTAHPCPPASTNTGGSWKCRPPARCPSYKSASVVPPPQRPLPARSPSVPREYCRRRPRSVPSVQMAVRGTGAAPTATARNGPSRPRRVPLPQQPPDADRVAHNPSQQRLQARVRHAPSPPRPTAVHRRRACRDPVPQGPLGDAKAHRPLLDHAGVAAVGASPHLQNTATVGALATRSNRAGHGHWSPQHPHSCIQSPHQLDPSAGRAGGGGGSSSAPLKCRGARRWRTSAQPGRACALARGAGAPTAAVGPSARPATSTGHVRPPPTGQLWAVQVSTPVLWASQPRNRCRVLERPSTIS